MQLSFWKIVINNKIVKAAMYKYAYIIYAISCVDVSRNIIHMYMCTYRYTVFYPPFFRDAFDNKFENLFMNILKD